MEQILQIFGANTDVNTVVRKNLVHPVRTRYVRMIQYVTSRYLSFRCEFYGCPIPKGGVLPTNVTPRTTPYTTPYTAGLVTLYTTPHATPFNNTPRTAPRSTGLVTLRTTPHTSGMPKISKSKHCL